jgi:hypothetical protein
VVGDTGDTAPPPRVPRVPAKPPLTVLKVAARSIEEPVRDGDTELTLSPDTEASRPSPPPPLERGTEVTLSRGNRVASLYRGIRVGGVGGVGELRSGGSAVVVVCRSTPLLVREGLMQASSSEQGLTLVHSSAQREPLLTRNTF